MAAPESLIPPVIVVDGVFFQIINTGIARVWRSLFRQWAADGFARHIVVVDRAGMVPKIPGVQYVNTAAFLPERFNADQRMLQQICDAHRASLFISTYYTMPLTTPSAMMVYDMIPEVRGDDLTNPWWQLKHLCIRHAVARMSISRSTTADLCRLFPEISPESVVTAYPGVDAGFVPCPEENIANFRRSYGLTRPYYLTIGMRAGYKGGPSVFEAFSQLDNRDQFDLVCVGGMRELEPELAARAPDARVHMLQLPDEQMPLAYAGATALVYPSAYEGFGLPVAEAMAVGCPAITCHNSSIPEVGGDAVLYVDHGDVPALARAMREIQEPATRKRLIAPGLERAKRFSWAAMGDTVAQTLLQAAAKYPPAGASTGPTAGGAAVGGTPGAMEDSGPQITVLAKTKTGGHVISFGKGAAPVAAAPAASPAVDPQAAISARLQQLAGDLRRVQENSADTEAAARIRVQRRRLAEYFIASDAGQLESSYMGEAGGAHRLICASVFASSPTPVEELPLLKQIEERLAARFELGTFFAGLLYRPAHHWCVSPQAQEVPEWALGAVPCRVLAEAAVRGAESKQDAGTVAADIFARHQLDPEKTLVLFGGGDNGAKLYARWGEALAVICRERQMRVVAVGGAAHAATSEQYLRELPGGGVNLCGHLTLPQTIAVLRKCKLSLGVENEWAHVAAAVERPHVVVLGGGQFGRFLPYSAMTSAVTVPLTCFGCGWACRFSRPHCVKDLLPEVLAVAIREALEEPSPRPRIYLQHYGFAAPPPDVLPFLNTDLLPPSLFDFTYVAPDQVEPFRVPRPSISGCPVRIVQIPARSGGPAAGTAGAAGSART